MVTCKSKNNHRSSLSVHQLHIVALTVSFGGQTTTNFYDGAYEPVPTVTSPVKDPTRRRRTGRIMNKAPMTKNGFLSSVGGGGASASFDPRRRPVRFRFGSAFASTLTTRKGRPVFRDPSVHPACNDDDDDDSARGCDTAPIRRAGQAGRRGERTAAVHPEN